MSIKISRLIALELKLYTLIYEYDIRLAGIYCKKLEQIRSCLYELVIQSRKRTESMFTIGILIWRAKLYYNAIKNELLKN